MAKISLFIGGVRPLPESGRLTGMYKQPVRTPLVLGAEGFLGDQQADRRVHGGPEKAVHLYPSRHYARLAARFPEVAAELVPGALGENIATDDLDENDVHLGEIWRLGSARLQVCQPRNPCWKIDERLGAEGMAQFIAEQALTGWYWRVVTPGEVHPDDLLMPETVLTDTLTLAEAMAVWHAHRPPLADIEKLANTPGIASQWQQKVVQRLNWLKQNPGEASPRPTGFHVKPEQS